MRMNFNALNGNVLREGKMFDEALGIPTYISLCSGYDGIGRGLERVIPNLRTIAHCEIEAYAIANLIAKMEEGQLDACPVFTDLKQFPFRELRGKTTILSAGFPCQPFSSAGKRQATEDPRHLWPWIANGVSAMRPKYCFFENVPGIISAKTTDGESVLKYVLRDLEQRGYRCTFGIFSAEEVGAPHQRKRVFILGYSERAGQSRSIMGQREEQLGGTGAWDGKELPNAKGKGLEGHSGLRTEQGGRRESTQDDLSKQELGNTSSKRPHRGSENCEGEQSEVLGERLESDEELADSDCDEQTKERGDNGEVLEVSQVEGQELSPTLLGGESTQGATQWPARPGEEQYEWEEPRVTEAQSFMGGATNGTQHRVDRLRLLGNGVVPQTAELAWKTLWKEMNETK